jgi:recombination protein RecA
MPRAATKKTPRKKAGDEAQAMTPELVAAMINKKWPGSMKTAADPSLRITRIPCGIIEIDDLLGGGFARRRHFELYGGYNVGKTYTTYCLIATAQASGLKCAFFDVEGTFDPEFAESCGVDLETLDMPEFDTGNRVIDIMEVLLRSAVYDVVVLDSIAALLPKAELEMDMEGGSMGTHQAKMMSAALRRLTAANKKSVIVYINQTREAIGIVFGKRSITSGGKAMGFYAGTRLEMVRTENIKRKAKRINISKGDEEQTDIVVGHRVLVRVEKDKTGGAKPQDETTFVFSYDLGGADPIEGLMYLGRKYGLVKKSPTHWWVEDYDDEKQAGRARFKKWLRKNVAVAEELRDAILERSVSRGTAEDEEDDDASD